MIATPREWGAGRHAFRRVYHSLKRLKHSTPCLLLLTCRTQLSGLFLRAGGRKLKPWRSLSGAVHPVSPTCFFYLTYCHPPTSHEKEESNFFRKLSSLMKTGTLSTQKTKGRLLGVRCCLSSKHMVKAPKSLEKAFLLLQVKKHLFNQYLMTHIL